MASYSLPVAIIFSFIFLSSLAAANEVTVGGKSGDWKIPPSSSYSFTEWAQKARFKVGDFIGTQHFNFSSSASDFSLILCFLTDALFSY